MKRILIAIIGLMLCCGLKAQTRACQYWFDGNYEQHVNVTLTSDSWDGQLDASGLADGIHTLHLHLIDTTMTFTRNYLFRKISTISPSTLDYYFWFDDQTSDMHHGTLGNGALALDATNLTTGIHTLHLMVKGDNYGYTRNYLFIKTEMTDFIPNLTYHCWFDEDMSHQQTGALGDGNILLDANYLEDGEHVVRVFFEGSTVAAPQCYVFTKGGEGEVYEITATAVPAEAGTVTGAGSYYADNTCTLVAIPNEGCAFLCWKENGNVVSENASYTFTVTGNRNLVAQFSGTGVDENDGEGLALYPNPVNDKLIVESNSAIRSCEVYSLTGQLVLSIASYSERLEVPVEKLLAGVYMVKLVTEKSVQTRRFVKE